MSKRLDDTASLILDKYDGDLGKLREAADKDVSKEKKLLKEFKVCCYWACMKVIWLPIIFIVSNKPTKQPPYCISPSC